MHHENQNFLGRSKHFGPFDGRSLFLKEDRPLRSEKAVVNGWEKREKNRQWDIGTNERHHRVTSGSAKEMCDK